MLKTFEDIQSFLASSARGVALVLLCIASFLCVLWAVIVFARLVMGWLMWQRFTLYDLRVIGHYLGVLIMFSSLTMLVPFLTAVFFGEWEPAALSVRRGLRLGGGRSPALSAH